MREVDQYFIDEYELAEDEWFFNKDSLNIGCLMKFNKDGSLPKTVKNWSYEGAPIYILWKNIIEMVGQLVKLLQKHLLLG